MTAIMAGKKHGLVDGLIKLALVAATVDEAMVTATFNPLMAAPPGARTLKVR